MFISHIGLLAWFFRFWEILGPFGPFFTFVGQPTDLCFQLWSPLPSWVRVICILRLDPLFGQGVFVLVALIYIFTSKSGKYV